jgi:hypothetical protein
MNTTLSAKDVQAEILGVMERDTARTHTHAGMAVELPNIASPRRIALNMVTLSRTGLLELVRDGSDFRSETKQYRFPKHD